MRGDFSSWNKEKDQNFNGVLHQQGRVLLDRDWNAQTEILNDWQETAGQDIIGAGVAAVPADAADSFKVTDARISGNEILISVNEGRVWADGLLVKLNEDIVLREATYLQPPIQNPAGNASDLPNDLRDAVILETWLEELNAFQRPKLLIEPALGGVDTTERVQTAFRFRLFRMDADDTCDSIIERLKDDFDNKGKLTAVLQPDQIIDGDCPVVEGGGYTGFEHQLYRIEVAQTRHNEPYFKWSQFNGGLVGRGRFDANKVVITANLNAIQHSGLTNFYMETLEEIDGYWQVTYGARVSLDTGTGSLNLPAAAADVFFGTAPDTKTVFFRLWNDIRTVADFSAEADLQDGIRLKFNSTDADKYTAHDFWTFPVRAGEISNNQTLVNNRPPEGIFYHRVPLAELFWSDDAIEEGVAEIEDCRRIFQPLTKLKTCCTYRVGDGINSHGDFTSIQKAIDALPKKGGEVCILPGNFRENITLAEPHNRNIIIKGCGKRTHIIGAEPSAPVIHVVGGINLRFESFSVLADDEGVGILLEGDEISANNEDRKILRNVRLENLQITAAARSAIEMHVGQFVYIHGCKIFIKDVSTEYAAVLLAGDDLLFEENEIRVMSGRESSWVKTDDPLQLQPAQDAAGGLHLSGGCERVRVINNLIMGGTGNGINLGNVDEMTVDGVIIKKYKPWWDLIKIIKQGKCNPNPGEVPTGETPDGTIFVAGAPLRDILIERNRILSMGRNGIGVDGFFGFRVQNRQTINRPSIGLELLSVENLVIIGNTINRCVNRRPVDINAAMTALMGYGGIALSDVENLVVRDNFITDNGADYLNATCGIFVLHGEGVEISRNQITNNGRISNQQAAAQTVKNGMRGGVVIVFSTQPTAASSAQLYGIPALTLRENVVSVPMGRALTMITLGDVSITGNRFLTQNLIPNAGGFDFLASHILLFSLSVSTNLKAQPVSYTAVNQGKYTAHNSNQQYTTKARVSNSGGVSAVDNQEAAAAASVSQLRLNLMSGTILFAHNQCDQNSPATGQEQDISGFASILIVSMSDIGFLSNQCEFSTFNNVLFFDTFLLGNTVRASDNFWQEVPNRVVLSAATFGITLNTTTDNQSTHCILARGGLYLDRHNLTLRDFASGMTGNVLSSINANRGFCDKAFGNLSSNFGQSPQTGGASTTVNTTKLNQDMSG